MSENMSMSESMGITLGNLDNILAIISIGNLLVVSRQSIGNL